jgi:hypothetical protein
LNKKKRYKQLHEDCAKPEAVDINTDSMHCSSLPHTPSFSMPKSEKRDHMAIVLLETTSPRYNVLPWFNGASKKPCYNVTWAPPAYTSELCNRSLHAEVLPSTPVDARIEA